IPGASAGASLSQTGLVPEGAGTKPVRDDLGSATGRLTGPLRTVPTTSPVADMTVPLITPTATIPPLASEAKRCSPNIPSNVPPVDVVPVMGSTTPPAFDFGPLACAPDSPARRTTATMSVNKLATTRLFISALLLLLERAAARETVDAPARERRSRVQPTYPRHADPLAGFSTRRA